MMLSVTLTTVVDGLHAFSPDYRRKIREVKEVIQGMK
jgi:hypothetical protein